MYIARYGAAAYAKIVAQGKKWNEEHPDKVNVQNREHCRKGGKGYDRHLEYMRIGIPGEKHIIRENHAQKWRKYKNIIAPGSQIHHEWIPGTADYRGVALVEKDRHMYGTVDVIEILKGKITLLREEEIRGNNK